MRISKILVFIILSFLVASLNANGLLELAKEVIFDNQKQLIESNRIDVSQMINVSGSIRVEKVDDFFRRTNSYDDYGVATLMPFFSNSDKFNQLSVDNDIIEIEIISSNKNVLKYFAEIKLKLNLKERVILQLEGKTTIYGYSREGNYSNNENYIAKYDQINNCYLPTVIKYDT